LAISGWLLAAILLASAKVAAGLAAAGIILLSAGSSPGEGVSPWVAILQGCAFSAVAFPLILGARRDPRPALLGAIFLVIASSFARRPLDVWLASGSPPLWLSLLARLQLDALLPALVWRFFCDFPHALDPAPIRTLGRAAVAVSVTIGLLLLLENLGLAFAEATAPASPFDARAPAGAYWRVTYGLLLPALPFALWRTRHAPVDERRRVALLLLGTVACAAPAALLILGFALSPALAAWIQTPAVHPFAIGFVELLILAIPISAAYAVRVDHALDLRRILRRVVEYGLARAIVAAAVCVPFLVLAGLLYAHRADTIERTLAGPSALFVGGALLAGVSAALVGRRAVLVLDRVFARAPYDSQRVLVALAELTQRARTTESFARAVGRELQTTLQLESAALLLVSPERGQFEDPTKLKRALDLHSELATFLANAPGLVRCDLEDRTSPLAALAATDREWLAEAGAEWAGPVRSLDGSALGILVLGAKASGLDYSRADLELLRGVVAACGTGLVTIRLQRDPAQPGSDAPAADAPDCELARECLSCGQVAAPEVAACPTCGARLGASSLPFRLLGKFQLERRIGSGAMGVVYLGTDLALYRSVALKTLPRTAPAESVRLRREARAMAAIAHRHLAVIYGVEIWRNTPLLILEYLERGTLAERLSRTVLESSEATELGMALMDALAHVHAAGMLHRDVKPSNIGFRGDGTPKLLDFGMARIFQRRDELTNLSVRQIDARLSNVSQLGPTLIGTPLYMSPEALRGEPQSVDFDLWSTAVVLYEALSGRHPFERGAWLDTLEAILAGQPPDVRELAPACPAELAGLLDDCLCRDRRRRPASAREVRDRLAALC
jgi:protein kinase-like protein